MDRLPERCEKHDLAVRPDGTCLLCSGGVPEPDTPPPPSRMWRLLQVTVTGLVVALALAIVYRVTVPLVEHSLDLSKDVDEEELRTGKRRDEEPKPTATRRTEPSASDLRAARRTVEVTLYSTSWCGYCRRARDYMRAQNIAFTEHDIERDPRAAEEMRRLNPRGSVPTIDVDGQVMRGFNERRFNALVDEAARRRI